MATGPGYNDAEGIYLFGEDDTETLLSELLNRGQESVSQQFGVDRARLDDLETQTTAAITVATGYTGPLRLVRVGPSRTLHGSGIGKSTAGNWPTSIVLGTNTDLPPYEATGAVWFSDGSVGVVRAAPSGSIALYPPAGKANTLTCNFSVSWTRG